MHRGAISFPKTGTRIEFKENEMHLDISGASLAGAPILREIIPTQNLSPEQIKQLIQIILVDGFNGLNPARPTGTLPSYFAAGSPFRQKLQEFGVTGTDGVPLYEEYIPFNIKDWLESVNVREAVTNKFVDITNRQPGQPFVPLGYSGGGMPILLTLSDEKYKGFGVDSVVLVGSPTLVTDLRWTSVDRVINIYGSKEEFLRGNESALIQMLGIDPLISDEVLNALPRVSHKFTRDNGPMETINIEIKDINHVGYFYDAADPNPSSLKVKANNFIARITQASLDPIVLGRELSRLGVAFEDVTDASGNRVRTYKVDLELIS